MFALRAFAPQGRQLARMPAQAAVLQQKRGMAGGDDEPDWKFVNWWDNPLSPNLWHKHQLAWFGVAFWGVLFYSFSGGKKEEAKPAHE